MKKIITLLWASSLCPLLHSQCDVPVPANAVVVDQDGTIADGGNYWVCQGVTAEFTGFAPFVYAEEGCDITLNGLLGVVVIKANGSVTLNGNNNNVSYDASTTFVDNGTSNNYTLCTEVVLDYDNAPSGGCDISSGIGTRTQGVSPIVFPNPAHDRLNIQVPGGRINGVHLLDMSGRVVRSMSVSHDVLDLTGSEPGNYVVEVHTGSGVMRKLVTVY